MDRSLFLVWNLDVKVRMVIVNEYLSICRGSWGSVENYFWIPLCTSDKAGEEKDLIGPFVCSFCASIVKFI